MHIRQPDLRWAKQSGTASKSYVCIGEVTSSDNLSDMYGVRAARRWPVNPQKRKCDYKHQRKKGFSSRSETNLETIARERADLVGEDLRRGWRCSVTRKLTSTPKHLKCRTKHLTLRLLVEVRRRVWSRPALVASSHRRTKIVSCGGGS